MTKQDIQTIVLMPVKNEDWIIDTTLHAADMIADHIIIADQQSTDKTVQLAKTHPKVVLIENTRTGHSNEVRWDLLDKCRELYGTGNLILNIDADEILPPYHFAKLKNKIINNIEPGKAWISSPWVQIWRSVNTFRNDSSVWSPRTNKKPFAFIDDGKVDYKRAFVINDHCSRVPGPENTPIIETNVPLLHFQFCNWKRTQEKQAWYRCREVLNGGNVQQINQKYNITKEESNIQYSLVPKKWYEGLNISSKIEMQDYESWYVKEIRDMIQEHGKQKFEGLDIEHVIQL